MLNVIQDSAILLCSKNFIKNAVKIEHKFLHIISKVQFLSEKHQIFYVLLMGHSVKIMLWSEIGRWCELSDVAAAGGGGSALQSYCDWTLSR